MITTLILGLSVLSISDIDTDTVRAFVSSMGLGQHGWEQAHSPRSGISVKAVWTRPSDHATLTIAVYPFKDSAQQESLWPDILGSLGKSNGTEMPSGFDVAGEVSSWSGNASQGVRWRLGRYAIVCDTRYVGTGTRDNHQWSNNDPSGDRQLTEGAVRACIGGIFGRDSGNVYNDSYRGHTVRAAQGINGHACWNITDWATTVNAQTTVNSFVGRMQIVCGGNTVIVPLGADSVKVGGTGRSLSEPSFAWSGDWYLEAEFLRSLG